MGRPRLGEALLQDGSTSSQPAPGAIQLRLPAVVLAGPPGPVMVGLRNAVAGTAVTNCWSDGNNAIAFGRGSAGFVVINHETGVLTQRFQTSLPTGTHCDLAPG